MQLRERKPDASARSPNSSFEGARYLSTKPVSDSVSGRSKQDFLESIRTKLISKYGSDQICKRAID